MIENWAATDKAKVFVSNCWIDTLQAFVPFPVYRFLFVSPFLQRNSHQVLPRNDRKCLDDLREIDVWRVVDKHSALLCPSRDTIINQ